MSKAKKRKLPVALNSFMWRELGQSLIFPLLILLGLLATLAVPLLIRLQDNYSTDERLPGAAVKQDEREPN